LDDLKRHIREFLMELKKIVVNRGLDVILRRENIDALAELGLTRINRVDEILTLSAEDYCSGPEPDNDRPGDLWIFGKQIGDQIVYIKLKIAQVGEEKIAKCLSFHTAKFPLCFPCREKERGE
jgi:hypothetical protein